MRIFSVLMMVIFILSGCTQDNVPFKEGRHYSVIPKAKASSNKQTVLYISMTCPHCYEFSKVFDDYANQIADDVQFERIPVLFNSPAMIGFVRLYATMRLLNVHDSLLLDAFEAIQIQKVPLQAKSVAIDWLVQNTNIDKASIENVYNSPQANQWMDMYNRSERLYQIRSIPVLIINGKYRVKLDSLAGETNEERLAELTLLIDFLHDIGTQADAA